MATAREAMLVANSQAYQDRIRFFVHKGAIAIMSEDVGTANHAERVTFANTVLAGEANIGGMATATVSDATVQAAIDVDATDNGVSDTALENAVNARLNAFAGVST